MQKVSINNIGSELTKIIKEYSKDIQNESLKSLEDTADKILNYIITNCPRSNNSSNHLADSFIKTSFGEGVEKIIYISSKTKYQLVHLIELGFKHRNGRHVAARPFLRPAYEIFTPKMIEDIKKIINKGKI